MSQPADGVVAALTAAPGQQVGLDETLAVITPSGDLALRRPCGAV
jgi:hypothetical protein